jgi:NTP pyrophosphatase (non-canonical NTP hydrolase)
MKKDEFWSDYQKQARATAIYPDQGNNLVYPILGLMGEFGEVCEKFKKNIRDNKSEFSPDFIESIKKEFGDVLWYFANIYCELKLNLNDIIIDEKVVLSDDIYYNTVICYEEIGRIVDYCYNIHCGLMTIEVQLIKFQRHVKFALSSLSKICKKLNLNLENIAQENIKKLQDRKLRGKLKGSGDNR